MSKEIVGKILSKYEGDSLPRLTAAHKAVLKDPRKVRQLTKLVRSAVGKATVWAEFEELVWGFAVSSYHQDVTIGDPSDEEMGEAPRTVEVDVWSFNTGYMEGRIVTVCRQLSEFPSAISEDDAQ